MHGGLDHNQVGRKVHLVHLMYIRIALDIKLTPMANVLVATIDIASGDYTHRGKCIDGTKLT